MFDKKIIVIKQMAEGFSSGSKPLCGICRLEKENGVLSVFLSLIGFTALSYGSYRLYVVGDDKTVVKKDVGKIPVSCVIHKESGLSLGKGVSVGVWAVKDDLPLLVAYQKSDDALTPLKEYGAVVVNDIIAERKNREKEREFDVTEKTAIGKTNVETVPAAYDDEAVATENFYDYADGITQKLDRIKELSDEYIRNENDGGNSDRQKKEKESEKDANPYENETNDTGIPQTPYYLKVKDELDGIFAKFPAETALQSAFYGSRFAKVYYGENKFYTVGLIRENGKEKYICYGVPSVYRETPPKELAGYCSFVPLSVFDLKGDGYFMMFQDAYTGKCVHKG